MKKSKFKLEFTLKQHTPMIHFQHDQAGATLRGTELKPKLDKFLIKQIELTETILENGKEKVVPKKEYDHWFFSVEHLSLDYKINIQALDVELDKIEKGDNRTLPMFFGAMGDEYDHHPKAKSFTKHSILVTFQSFNDDLKKAIGDNFSQFMARTNFGTRQNKGYGCFYLDNTVYPDATNSFGIYPSIAFNIPKGKNNERSPDLIHIFNVINYYYQRLKSGINYCFREKEVDYQHSFLKLYLSRQGLGSMVR